MLYDSLPPTYIHTYRLPRPSTAWCGTTKAFSSSTSEPTPPSSFFTDGGDVQEKNPAHTYRGSTPTPCVTYWIGDSLYLALTNRCNTVPLPRTRGPGFNLAARLSKAGFLPLEYDPSAEVSQSLLDYVPTPTICLYLLSKSFHHRKS